MKTEVEFLKKISFFEEFTSSELENLLGLSRIDRYNMDEAILQENEADVSNASHYYVVLRGAVDVIKKNKIMATLKKGECFGELAYLLRQKRTASVISTSGDTLIMEIDGDKINNIVKPEIKSKLIQKIAVTLAVRLTNTSQMIVSDPGIKNGLQEALNEKDFKELNLFQFLSRAKLLKTAPFFAPFSSKQMAEILTLPHFFISFHNDQKIESNKKKSAFCIFYILLKGGVKLDGGSKYASVLNRGDCFVQSTEIPGVKKQKTELIAAKGSKIFSISLDVFEGASNELQLLFYKQFSKFQSSRLAR